MDAGTDAAPKGERRSSATPRLAGSAVRILALLAVLAGGLLSGSACAAAVGAVPGSALTPNGTTDPTTAAAPGSPPAELTARRGNFSGTRYHLLSWASPPDLPADAVAAFEVSATGGQRDFTTEVRDQQLFDYDNICSPSVVYEVRALTFPSTAGDPLVRGEPTRFTLDTPVDCTPEIEIATAEATDRTIAEVLTCVGYSRGGTGYGRLSLLVDGVERWTGECDLGSAFEVTVTAVVEGLEPGTEYSVQAVVSSPSGSKTSEPVPARTQ